MTDNEYEIDFDNLNAETPPSLGEDGDDSADYSPDIILEAKALEKYSIRTILAAIVLKNNPTLNFEAAEETWSAQVYTTYCAAVGSYGKKIHNRPLGVLDRSALAELTQVDPEILQAAITSMKATVVTYYTDATLAREAAKMKGARLIDTDDTRVELSIPGCPDPIIISKGSGYDRGRVISGGPEFIKWHNLCHSSAYSYEATSPLARDAVFAAMTIFNVKIDKGNLLVSDRPKITTNAFRDFVGYLSKPIAGRKNALKKLLLTAWMHPLAKAPMAKDLKDRLEFIVTRHLEEMSATARKFFTDALGDVRADLYKRMESMKAKLYTLSAPNSEITLDVVKKYSVGTTPIAGKLINSMGAVRSFVEESRNTFRDDHDLSRKSDSCPMGFAIGEVSSVPEKIARCITALRLLTDNVGDKFARVDAYGTGSHNHMSAVVEAAAGDITYYDIKKNFSPPNGGKFAVADIELLGKDDGKGKYLFDDTFNGGDEHSTGQIQFNATRKIEAVCRANYEGGFMKLCYGTGDEAGCAPGKLPPTIEKILTTYSRINLLPGGSVHSPEYFVVFAKGTRTSAPARATAKGFNIGLAPCAPGDFVKLTENYVKSWMAYRAVEIISANMVINVQVACGQYCGIQIPTKSGFFSPGSVTLGGSNVVGTNSLSEKEMADNAGDVSFLDDVEVSDVVDDANEEVLPPDVGMLGSGNSKGDGPLFVAIDPSIPDHADVSRFVAVQEACSQHNVIVHDEFPPFTAENYDQITFISLDCYLQVADEETLRRIAAPRFKGLHVVKRGVECGAYRFDFIVYVPRNKRKVAFMFSPCKD